MGAATEHGGWGGAGVIPSISFTCSGAAMKLSSLRSLAAGAVGGHASLRVIPVEGAGWP